MADVDLHAPLFTDHPAGWQSPEELFDGFALAWALELRERRKISPIDPFGNHVQHQLPVQYRYDTLGELLKLNPLVQAAGGILGRSSVTRLMALCGAWRLFETMNKQWQLQPRNFEQYGETLKLVTGGLEMPNSLFQEKSARLAKCLLAIRVRRAFSQQEELDLAEEWFVSGDPELTFRDSRGYDSLLFHFGLSDVDLPLIPRDFSECVWDTASVLVDQLGPDKVIVSNLHRMDELYELLTRGGRRAEAAQREMSPVQLRGWDGWPGWQ